MTRRQKWLTGIVTLSLLVLLFFVAWSEVQARELSPAILVPIFIAPLTVLIVVLAASNDEQTTPPTEDRRSLISRVVDEADDDERAYLRRALDDRKRKTS